MGAISHGDGTHCLSRVQQGTSTYGATDRRDDQHAGVAELADALVLGTSVERRAGSNPVTRTEALAPIV